MALPKILANSGSLIGIQYNRDYGSNFMYNYRIREKSGERGIGIEKVLEQDYKHKIRVVHISGQFFFGSATQLISKFEDMLGTKYLILNYESDDLLDISAIFALEDIILRLQSQEVKIILVIKNENVLKQLQNHKITEQIGDKQVFYNELNAIDYAKEKLLQENL